MLKCLHEILGSKFSEVDINCEGLTFLKVKAVCKRYGVCSKTLGRWADREALDFPKPIRINGQRFWSYTDIVAWERSRASQRIGGAT